MAKLHVTELRGYGTTAKEADVQSVPGDDVLAGYAITIATVTSSALNANTSLLYIVAGAACGITLSPASAYVAASAGTGIFLASSATLFVSVPAGEGYVLSLVTDTL
jgi:hypothetical protein